MYSNINLQSPAYIEMHLKIKIIRCILAFPPKVESYLWLFFVFLLTLKNKSCNDISCFSF